MFQHYDILYNCYIFTTSAISQILICSIIIMHISAEVIVKNTSEVVNKGKF